MDVEERHGRDQRKSRLKHQFIMLTETTCTWHPHDSHVTTKLQLEPTYVTKRLTDKTLGFPEESTENRNLGRDRFRRLARANLARGSPSMPGSSEGEVTEAAGASPCQVRG